MTNFEADKFWEQRLTKIGGLEGVGYAKIGRQFNYWAYQVRRVAFNKIIAPIKNILPTAKVLDIGSGTGFYIDAWQQAGAKNITGIDITEIAVQNLKKTFPHQQFVTRDVSENLKSAPELVNAFDVISAMDVLFHIVDADKFEAAVANISAMLKQGGYFVYTDNFVSIEATTAKKHQVSRTKEMLLQLFEKNNLKVIEMNPFMVLTNYPVDSKNKFLHAYWFMLENLLYVIKPLGSIFGPLLFNIDKALLNSVKKGPTTKIVLLKKV